MKVTRKELKQLIQEEIENLNEGGTGFGYKQPNVSKNGTMNNLYQQVEWLTREVLKLRNEAGPDDSGDLVPGMSRAQGE